MPTLVCVVEREKKTQFGAARASAHMLILERRAALERAKLAAYCGEKIVPLLLIETNGRGGGDGEQQLAETRVELARVLALALVHELAQVKLHEQIGQPVALGVVEVVYLPYDSLEKSVNDVPDEKRRA